jgi:choice-of-anchor B domain-containing protein
MTKHYKWFAALLLAGAIFPAAADDGKPRYVAGNGRDQGDCQNRFRPCLSLSYAISQAGKGDAIQVAEGQYSVRDTQQLYDLLSTAGRVNGGFRQVSGYSERNAAPDTVLVGVPPEFRERFEAAGFTVIADTKGLGVSREETQRMRRLSVQFAEAEQSHAATPCVGNTSAGFACQSVGMLAHLSLQDLRPASGAGNDVWGFHDLNTGREYAFMGLQNGVAVVDITNPEAPEQVASASGSATTWRDIKVYQLYDSAARRWRAYAYVTADSVPDVLMVLDLSALPNGVERVSFSSDFRAAHNAYLVNADYTFGLARTTSPPQLGIAGANLSFGNHRLYSLENPRAPQLRSVSTGGYAHDLASFPVADARRNQCGPTGQTQAVCQVMSDFNENTVDVWDVTVPSSPQRLASQPYADASYVHSGWWTEDGRYLLVHDELDEQNRNLNTTVRIFDLASLTNPVLAATWVGPTRAIDHNGYVKGNRYYISNYSEGLTVLDLSNPLAPSRIGYFDTYPASAQTGFVGAWGVYPFSASGTIAVGDINSGLYLLRNDTLATPRGSFAMASAAMSGTEGQSLTLTVNRSGGAQGAVSVQLEALNANTTTADASLSSTTLNWADGDSQPKTVTVNLASDAQSEELELLLVRLQNPQGGASIAYPDTSFITIGEAGRATTLRSLQSAPTVDDTRGKVLIPVTRHGSAAGEARVSYRTLGGGTFGGVTATQGDLVWADGDTAAKTVTVQINSTALSAGQSGTFQVELFNAVNASIENDTGGAVATLPLTVTVNDTSTAPPPQQPPPPPSSNPGGGGGGGGGGGAISLLWVALLAGFALARTRRRTRASPTAAEFEVMLER